MSERTALSKKVRFEVFKRDAFTCQYCGEKAPAVVLHIDHVVPVSKNGDNDMLNLIAACSACNGGKGARLLDDASVIEKQRKQLDDLHDRHEQLEMLLEWKNALLAADQDVAARLEQYWSSRVEGWSLNEQGSAELRKLLKKHSAEVVVECIDAAVDQYVRHEDGKPVPGSVQDAWHYVPRIARMKQSELEKPYLKDLFFIRATARNRSGYFNDSLAIQMLEEAYDFGGSIEALRRIARTCKGWSAWKKDMDEYIDELFEAKGRK